MKHKQFPLLTRLLLAQTLIGFLGLIILLFAYNHFHDQKTMKAISDAKSRIVPILEIKNEKIRSYQYLGLEHAINEELTELKKEFQIRDFKVLPNQDAQKLHQAEPNDSILVPSSAENDELVIYTLLDRAAIGNAGKDSGFSYVFYMVTFFLVFMIGITARYIYSRIYSPFLTMYTRMKNMNDVEQTNLDTISASGEIQTFIQMFNELLVERKKLEKQAAISLIAQQVSHDIRSPLAALNMITDDLSELEESKRQIIRNSINRIRDIANGLSLKKRELQQESIAESPQVDRSKFINHMLAYSIENIISEKNLTYPSARFKIETNLDTQSYSMFSILDPVEFQRLISNLLNNSIEATPNGLIRISMTRSADDQKIVISIEDNGSGIPQQILSNLGKRGVTYGKQSGSGLGLFHAIQNVENWGGKLSIQSKEKVGTTITITLPASAPPVWLRRNLDLTSIKQTVVVDDDDTIHSIWKSKLHDHSIHLRTPNDLRRFLFDLDDYEQYLFLVDHEFIGEDTNGLSLIHELNIAHQSVLVTSHFDEHLIQSDCEKIGLKIIPKFMAPQIQVVQ
jgi:signal transduction histidine kinase